MAWGDIAAGLGGGLSGGLDAYKWQAERKDKKEHDQLVNDIKAQLQEMKGKQELEQIEKRNVGKMAIQQLVNVGKLDVRRLENEGEKYLEELHQTGQISLEEKMQIGRMSLAEVNNAASQKRVETQGQTARDVATTQGGTARAVAGINAASAGNVANIGRGGAWDIANLLEGGRTTRGQTQSAIDLMNARSRQAAAQAALQKSADPWGTNKDYTPPTLPDFGASFQSITGAGQAPFVGAPDPGTPQVPLNPPPQPGLSTAPGMSTPTGPAPAPPQAPPARAPAAAPAAKGVVPVNPRMQQPAPQAAPAAPTGIAPINQGAGRLPGGAALPQAAAPGGGARQLVQQVTDLATQIKQMPPGPQQDQAKQQLAILRTQLAGAK